MDKDGRPKRTRRAFRDKSEFVSVEVGMREFKKRLASSDAYDGTLCTAATVEDLTQNMTTTRSRRKPALSTKVVLAKSTQRKCPVTKKNAQGAATLACGQSPVVKKNMLVKGFVSEINLKAVKEQLAREQEQRVEDRIKTLLRKKEPVVALCASANYLGTLAVGTTPCNISADITPAESAVCIDAAAALQDPKNEFIKKESTRSDAIAAGSVASSTPGNTSVPSHTQPLGVVTNNFIADDTDDDVLFALALEEVEQKLASPLKRCPISEGIAASEINKVTSVNVQDSAAVKGPVYAAFDASPVKEQLSDDTKEQVIPAAEGIDEAGGTTLVPPDVFKEMERLRKENDRLRQSNELLQAAATSPAHIEAPSTKHSCSFADKVDPIDASMLKSVHPYLELAANDCDEIKKQPIPAFIDQISARTSNMDSNVIQSVKSEYFGDFILEKSLAGNKDDQVICKTLPDVEMNNIFAIKQEVVAENASVVGRTLELKTSLSTPFSRCIPAGQNERRLSFTDVEMVTGKTNYVEHSETNKIGNEGFAQPFISKIGEKVSEFCTNKVDDVDENDTEEDEEDAMMQTSTVDIGNYPEYKICFENRMLNEDKQMKEHLSSRTFVAEETVQHSQAPSSGLVSESTAEKVSASARKPEAAGSSELNELIVASSHTDLAEGDAVEDTDKVILANDNDKVKRGESTLSPTSESESESDLDKDEDESVCQNVLEAALKAAGNDSIQSSVAGKGDIEEGRSSRSSLKPKLANSLTPSPALNGYSKKRKSPGHSSVVAKKPLTVKSSLLWPALDDFYDALLDMSPRDVRRSEKHRSHLQQYEKLPTKYSNIDEYCKTQLAAILEELIASVSNVTNTRDGSGPKRQLSLSSVSPCGNQSMSALSTRVSLKGLFSESGFTGQAASEGDYILTFDGSQLKRTASSNFNCGDLLLLRSPRWKSFELCFFGVVLSESIVAEGGKTDSGRPSGYGDGNQVCVLVRARQQDRNIAENFDVLTELCLANRRTPSWQWSLQQVFNLTTSAREYQAIKAISFFPNDLKQVLLRGQLAPKTAEKSAALSSMLSPPLLKYLHKHYNDSQLQAILGCLGEDRWIIIQGPPGTGKTKTILGLLSALLDGAGLSSRSKAQGSSRIRIGASFHSAPTLSVTSIRIMVAAPSNAAVDELVLRVLSEGLYDGKTGETYRPRIVRVGRSESQQLSGFNASREASESRKNRNKIRKYASEVEEVLLESLVSKHRKTFSTGKQTRQAILKNAQIVFCTLSGAGSAAMCDFAQDFDALIIDEAAQAVEASTLIPFKFRPQRMILFGDHRQLPATVLSKKLVLMGYDQSLQQRLVESGSSVLLLTQQYRMHPEIAAFPSTYFYSGRLVQDDNMRDWTGQDYHNDRNFKPLLFLDVQGAQSQVNGSTSLRNMSEVDAVIQILRGLITKYPSHEWMKRIGVIAPYKQQIYEMRGAIQKLETVVDCRLGIEVNTVDGFQGREKEIIIYSCVRTSNGGRKWRSYKSDQQEKTLDAFWSDERRMNVAITRAKSSLWIVGNSALLKQSTAWRALIQHIKDHDRYISGDHYEVFHE
ncbi:hypothetical protein CCR75_006958 [Bremia lactucae]|uniref:Uncharacterized protein n=1 Tax=Bremia lactucae TaxID=4779 RepID=A0A976IFC2_BRELC|nr:hypothetical protein CCR75_006958 [Bremia lactucae]